MLNNDISFDSKKKKIIKSALLIGKEVEWNSTSQLYNLIENDLSLTSGTISLYFPNIIELTSAISIYFDRVMVIKSNINSDKISNKILFLLSNRFEEMLLYKESLSKMFMFLSLPYNISHSMKLSWQVSNTIWLFMNDKSTDYNYYSKRLILSGIYVSSLLHFFNNNDIEKTISFIGYQLKTAAKIGKIKSYFLKKSK